MMDLADVTIHINETLTDVGLYGIENRLRELDGVVSVGGHEAGPHLMVVEFNPDKLSTKDILLCVQNAGVHAELIGL